MTEQSSEALVAAVRAELAAAGLSLIEQDSPFGEAGALVEGGEGSDPAVWVSWHASAVLTDAGVDALQAGAYRRDGSEMHPAIRHSGTVSFAMADAIAAVLTSAGYAVRKDADDLNPRAVLVHAGEPGPSWRDPIAPMAGTSRYLAGARVRLVEGEHAGAVTSVVTWRAAGDGSLISYTVEHPNGDGELDVAPSAITFVDVGM